MLEDGKPHQLSDYREKKVILYFYVARCGVLKKWDDVSFPKALGTVVTERAIDSLLVLLITALVFVMQIPVFLNFFEKTGTSMDSLLCQFTATRQNKCITIKILYCLVNICNHLHVGQIFSDSKELWCIEACCYGLSFLYAF